MATKKISAMAAAAVAAATDKIAALQGGANVGLLAAQINNTMMYRAMGSSMLAIAMGCPDITLAIAGGTTLVDGQLKVTAIYIPYACTITGVAYNLKTQGNYTPDNYNGIGLYSESAGPLTLRASTAGGAGTIWSQTANFYKVAFETPYVVAAPGLYYIGLLYNTSAETTAPVIAGGGSIVSTVNAIDFTNSRKICGVVATQATLPDSQALSGVTSNGSLPFLFLY